MAAGPGLSSLGGNHADSSAIPLSLSLHNIQPLDSEDDGESEAAKQLIQPIAEKIIAKYKAKEEEAPLLFFVAGEVRAASAEPWGDMKEPCVSERGRKYMWHRAPQRVLGMAPWQGASRLYVKPKGQDGPAHKPLVTSSNPQLHCLQPGA